MSRFSDAMKRVADVVEKMTDAIDRAHEEQYGRPQLSYAEYRIQEMSALAEQATEFRNTFLKKYEELPPEQYLHYLLDEEKGLEAAAQRYEILSGQTLYHNDDHPIRLAQQELSIQLGVLQSRYALTRHGDYLDRIQDVFETEAKEVQEQFVTHFGALAQDNQADIDEAIHNILRQESPRYRKILLDPDIPTRAKGILQGWRLRGLITEDELKEALSPNQPSMKNRPKPSPHLIRSPRDAELVAVEWMRYWGFDDARATPVGADEGIDVMSEEAVAQVKAHMVPIGRPDLQNLAGVAAVEGKSALFFALNGYTAQAIEWAAKAQIALFTFDLQGVPEPVNDAAQQYAD